jgi:solute carrier family 35 (UDP-xylose/UDP-N-acetylglucosamine transporter), member B4
VTFIFTLPSHSTVSKPPTFLKKPAVPILQWLPAALMFFTVNMLNNFALGSISVPVHIILRSGGSVMTMVVGYFWGKKYNKGQVGGVSMLTIGVIVAAMADAKSKVL